MSVTSLSVGFMAVLKKLMTTALKRSLSAGYRLKACCDHRQSRKAQSATYDLRDIASETETNDLGQELTEDPDEFVVNQLTALDAGFFEALDLLPDDHLECGGADEERLKGSSGKDRQISKHLLAKTTTDWC